MVGCWRCTYPSIHFFVSRSRSVVDCARVQAFTFLLTKTLSRSRSVVWCVVVVCCGGVLWWCVVVVCCGGVLWWCVVVVRVCGCVVKFGTLSLSCSLSFLFSFPFFFSLIFLFLSSFSYSYFFLFLLLLLLILLLFFLFPFFLSSSLLLTLLFLSLHAKGTFIATANELHGMFPPLLLPPLLSSLLPPSHTQKKGRDLFITGIFPARNVFITVLN